MSKMCGCGCGKKLRSDNETGFYLSRDNGIDHKKEGSDKALHPCACGCSSLVGLNGARIPGHYPRTVANRVRLAESKSRLTPKAMVMPTMRDLAWAAGFLEGEGCFRASRTRYPNGQCVYHATVNGVQKEREPLEALLAFFGGRIHYSERYSGFGTGGTYRWEASGARARGVMMTLYPFMTARRKAQIRSALR
jgi:hypothetical protein